MYHFPGGRLGRSLAPVALATSLASVVLFPGCGGSTSGNPDAGAHTTGEPCSVVGSVSAQDACTACVCESSGQWSCQTITGGSCAQCPTNPVNGDACDVSGQSCPVYEFCAAGCLCVQGQLSCIPVAPGCGTPGCPDQPGEGAACSDAGLECHYSWPVGCTEANCSCSGGVWTCTVDDHGCADAG